MILLITHGILFLAGAYLAIRYKDAWCAFGAGLMCSCFIYDIATITTPAAMDVYQGKTTLEITYKDGTPIDSVVVFKEKGE